MTVNTPPDKAANALARIIRKAIKHEENKRVQKMVRTFDRRSLTPNRIYKDVQAVMSGCMDIDRFAPNRTNRIQVFRKLKSKASHQNLELDDLPRWIWPYLECEDEENIETLMQDQALLCKRLREAKLLDENLLEKGFRDRPTSNPMVDRLVNQLAEIYQRYTGYRVTYTYSFHNGRQSGYFFKFVRAVLSGFMPHEVAKSLINKRGMLRRAISDGGLLVILPPSTGFKSLSRIGPSGTTFPLRRIAPIESRCKDDCAGVRTKVSNLL